jgi:hypothetical protein
VSLLASKLKAEVAVNPRRSGSDRRNFSRQAQDRRVGAGAKCSVLEQFRGVYEKEL